MRGLVVGAVALLSAIQPNFALSQQIFEDGNKLFELCRGMGSISYVTGAFDGLSVSRNYLSEIVKCVPKGATAGQINDVTCKFLMENPADRHLPASILIARALNVAFCKAR